MRPPPDNHRGVSLAVLDLHKSYSAQKVLDGVSFSVEAGEIFVLMGPSGSGKSVLLRHIIGLEPADAGDILIAGEPIHAEGVRDRHHMAMVFQSGALLNSLTVGENVGLYLSEHRLKPPAEIARLVGEKLEAVGLKGVEQKLPAELSGGMKKRAAIARALVSEPQLILYDEPTSELDPGSAAVVGHEIAALNRRLGVTSVVVTHDRDLAFGIAGRLAVILGGRIMAAGAPEEVRNSPTPSIRDFLNARMRKESTP